MIHVITLFGTKGEIYQEILSSFDIFFIARNEKIAARFSSLDEAETVWALFVERFNQIVNN